MVHDGKSNPVLKNLSRILVARKGSAECTGSKQPPDFYMMASTITGVYADRLKINLERRHKVKGRTGFSFSDV